MYVCICAAVTEGDIKDQISAGAKDVEALSCALGVARQCQSCLETIEKMLEEEPPFH